MSRAHASVSVIRLVASSLYFFFLDLLFDFRPWLASIWEGLSTPLASSQPLPRMARGASVAVFRPPPSRCTPALVE
jgi:hypothetical protein